MSAGPFASPLSSQLEPAGGAGGPVRSAFDTRWARGGPVVHGLLLAVSFAIFAWQVALPSGVVSGAIAAVLGAIAAERAIAARFRLPVVISFSVLLGLIGTLASTVFVDAELPSQVLGPTHALAVGDAFRWAVVLFALTTTLRAVAIRYRAALALEGSVVVLAVATTVAAHRDGMIARPLEVADWFWTQGLDPVVAFLGIGLLAAALFASVLAYRRSPGRTFFQLLLVMLFGILIASSIHSRDTQIRRDVTGSNAKKDDDKANGKPTRGGKSDGKNKDQNDQGRGGFKSDDMPRPGSSSGGQNRPAAVVVFHKEVRPALGVFYFRHAVFSQFNGTRLVQSSRTDVDPDALHDFVTEKRIYPTPTGGFEGRELVATDVAMLQNHSRMFLLTDPTEAEPLPNPDPARFVRAYRAVSAVVTEPYEHFLGEQAGDSSWSEEVWQYYTALPKDERYHHLAAELEAGLKPEYQGDPMARAILVKTYLEKTVTYSFKNNYDGEADPTAAFLFGEDKRGYCVHTAHAAAYLLRAMGVPTRVSAGYAIPAANLGEGSSLLIKQGDAHAWAEIFLEGTGWIPIEVTPEKTDVQPQQFQEKDLQQLLGEMARKSGRASSQAAPPPKLAKAIKALLKALPWVLLGLLIAAYGTKIWRLIAPAITPLRRRPRIAYRAALDRLSALGFARESGESREKFAGRVAFVSPTFGTLTAVHLKDALGPKQSPPPAEVLRAPTGMATQVGRELRGQLPIWRWLIGALNPVSWFWSR